MRSANVTRWIKLIAAACAMAAPASAGSSAGIELRAQVPISCAASLIAVTEVTFNPLLINATVQRNCNTAHTLLVTYLPASLSNPSSLNMSFNGNGPNASAPGSMTFGNLASANSTQVLTVAYAGPPAERTQIKTTLAIQVSVP